MLAEPEIVQLEDFAASLNMQKDSAVLVEGRRDVKALRDIGYSGAIIEFHRFGGIAECADAAAEYGTVIMMLDWDRKGRYLASRMTSCLQRRTKVDRGFRRRLHVITKGRVRCTEQLSRYKARLENEAFSRCAKRTDVPQNSKGRLPVSKARRRGAQTHPLPAPLPAP